MKIKKILNKISPNPEESGREGNVLLMDISFQLLKAKYNLPGLIVA